MWCCLEAGCHHGLAEAGQGQVKYGRCDLRGNIARGEPRAARGADKVKALTQGQIGQQGAQGVCLVRQKKALAVAEWQMPGQQCLDGRAALVFSLAKRSLVGKRDPGQGATLFACAEGSLTPCTGEKGSQQGAGKGMAGGWQPQLPRQFEAGLPVDITKVCAHGQGGQCAALFRRGGQQPVAAPKPVCPSCPVVGDDTGRGWQQQKAFAHLAGAQMQQI